jgi:hypothetical protein
MSEAGGGLQVRSCAAHPSSIGRRRIVADCKQYEQDQGCELCRVMCVLPTVLA